MEAVYKSGGKVAFTEQGLVLDKPSAVILKVAPEQITKSTRVGNDLVLILVDGTQIYVNGFFAAYAEEGRNDLVLEDQQGVLWWGQYGGAWEGFEFTEIESNESVAAWLPWLVGLGLGGLAVSSGGSGGGGKNVNNPPEPIDPNEGLSPGAPGHVPGQEFSNGGYKVTVREDQPFNGKVVGQDSDGDSLTYGLGTPPAHGTVTIDKNTGEYTYTPNKDWNGPGTDSFEVIVDDGKGGKTATTVTVNVGAEQDAYDDIEGTGFGKSVTVDVLGNDKFAGHNVKITQVDGKAITEGGAAVALTDGSGSVKLVGGQLEFTPKAGFVGDAKFSYTAQTDGGTPEQANVTVTVAANQLPEPTDPNIDPGNPEFPGQTFTPGPGGGYKITVGEDQPFNGKVTGTDKDGDELTYTQGTGPSHGTVTIDKDTGKYTYTPDPDYNGPDAFTVIVDDGKGGKTTTTVTVEFTPEQDVTDDTATTGYDKPVSIDVLGNDDFEGANLTITQVDGKAITEGGAAVALTDGSGSVKLVGGQLEFTPKAGFVGDAKFSYTAQTDGGTPETANVTVTVAANQLPEPTDPNEGLNPGDPGYVPNQKFDPSTGNYELTTPEDTSVSGKVVGTDVDGDTLTYTEGTPPQHGTVSIDPNTGEYTYTPNKDYNGPDEFTVVVDDGNGGKVTSKVTITVEPVNDNPVPVDPNENLNPGDPGYVPNQKFDPSTGNYELTTPEDTSVSGKVVGTDVDGDTLTYTEGTPPQHGTVSIDPNTGEYTYTPNKDYNGPDEFTVVVDDGNGGKVISKVTITVEPVNDNPVPVDPNEGLNPGDPGYVPNQKFDPSTGNYELTTPEDTSVSGKVVGTDVDGDTLTYTEGTPPQHGTVSIDPNTGEYTYTPNKDYNGPDEFTVVVDDGNGGKVTSKVTITVEPVNDNPVPVDPNENLNPGDPGYVPNQKFDPSTGNYELTTPEDTSVSGKVVGTDVDGDTLTYTEGTPPQHGTVSIDPNTGEYTYTPNKDYNGPDEFTVVVDDGNGGKVISKVTITVEPVNDNPVPVDPNEGLNPGDPGYVPNQKFDPSTGNYELTTPEDTSVSGKVVGTDVDGDTLTYTEGTPPQHGTVSIDPNTGEYTYTPNKDYNGPDEFTVVVDDGNGGKVTSKVTITVEPVNDNPVPVDPNENLNPGDPGYVPNQKFDPSTGNYELTTPEDTSVSGKVVGTDVDGDTLTYTEGTPPQHGTVSIDPNTGEYTYTPNKDYNGPDEFTVVVDDGNGGKVISKVTITVEPVNDNPVPVDPNEGLNPGDPGYVPNQKFDPSTGNYELTTPEDTSVSGKVVGTDVDGDTLTYTEGTPPQHGTVSIDPNTGEYTYTPNKDYNGPDEFTVVVDDGNGGKVTSKVTITVEPVNDNPVPVDPNENLNPGDPGYVPNQKFDPSTGNYELTTPEDTSVSGKVVGTDVDGDTLTYTEGTPPQHGTVSIDPNTGEYTYTPNKDYNGPDEFTVVVDDGNGGKVISKVTITVEPVNDNPVPVDPNEGLNPGDPGYLDGQKFDPMTGNYELTTKEDTPVEGRVVGTDVDGDTLTYTEGTPPQHGTVSIDPNTGEYTYTPNKDYNGPDEFTVVVDDGNGGKVTSKVTITVEPVNDNPVPVDPNEGLNPGDPGYVPNQKFDPSTGNYELTTPEDTSVSGKVVGTDVDGDTLTYTEGTPPQHGTVSIDPNTGEYTYTPGKDYNGPDEFTVVVDDGNGGKVTSKVTITVEPVNDNPVPVDPNENLNPGDPGYLDGQKFDPMTGNYELTTKEDTPVEGRVVGTDVDGDTLTYTEGTPPQHGTVSIDPNTGEYTYTPNKDYNGPDEFTVVVDDGNGGKVISKVTITVEPVNDNPVPVDPNEGLNPGDPGYVPNQKFDPSTGNYELTTPEDTSVSGKVVGTDVDGDTLTYTEGTPPQHGTVSIDPNTGEYTYTPGKDYNGSDSFTVVVDDGQGGKVTSTVNITVTPVNDDPVPVDPNEGLNPGDPGYVPNQKFDPSTGNYELTTPEDTSVSGKVVGTDVDGDTLTYTEGTPPQHGTVSIDPNTGEYTYTPNKDYNGPDEFTVVVDDGNGGKVTSTVNITVTPVNDDPVFVNPSDDAPVLGYAFEYDENSVAGKVLGQVKATDIDSDLVTYSIDPASNLNGWYAINAVTGEITLTAAGAASYANDFERGGNIHMIKVVATDSDGGKTEVTVTLNELDLNDNAPVWTKDTAVTVSEEGLLDGVQTDPVNPKSAIQTGTILIEDADTVGTQTVTLSAPNEPLTSGGVAVVWSGSGTTDDPLVGKAGGKVIIEASIDNGGHYTVTLKGPVDHPKLPANNGENSLELNLKVTVSDGVHTDTGKLTVTIGDGIPVAEPTESDYVLPTQNTNLLLILDVSGSMRNLDGGTKTRMQIMQEAVKMMLDSYGALGDVAVRIVIFGSGAATHGSQWESIASAKAYVDSLTTSGMPNGINGATHHSTALTEAMSAFQTSAGKISGGNNVAYLLTDGASTPNYEIKTALENQWKTFLTDNQMNSMAFGISPGAAGTEPNINPAAYDGRTGDDTDAVMVPDTAKLPPILRDSVGVNTSGSVTSGGLLGESDWGADGGSVDSITVNGRVYHADGSVTGGTSNGTWNSTTHTWTINTEGTGGDINKGGKLVIDMDDGSYTYVPPLIATGTTHVENIGFELIDADGDKAGSDLTLTVHPAGTVLPSPAPAAFAMSAGLGLEHLDALATDADDPAALPALHDVLQPQTAADEAGGNIAGLGSADAPAAPAAPVAAPQDLALYMPAPLPEEELLQPVHV